MSIMQFWLCIDFTSVSELLQNSNSIQQSCTKCIVLTSSKSRHIPIFIHINTPFSSSIVFFFSVCFSSQKLTCLIGSTIKCNSLLCIFLRFLGNLSLKYWKFCFVAIIIWFFHETFYIIIIWCVHLPWLFSYLHTNFDGG